MVSAEEVASTTFDYVVVGGGTAGLVLAARLTEDANVNVLVLEAGEDRLQDPKVNIPALMSQLYEDPDYDWSFKSTPQAALNGRVVAQPRGKILGGSSAINFMMLANPSKVDIDNWERLGNPGWGFDQLLPYYKRFETYNPPDEELGKALGSEIIDQSLHGDSGPVQITFPHGASDLDAAWRPAFQTLGLGAEQDPRLGTTLGGYAVLKFLDKQGRRSYAAPAYYAPIAQRKNLTVLTKAHVQKVLIQEEDGVVSASGVAFSHGGKDYTVPTSHEVILSAGTFQSPQILELSGVGSRSILEKHDIKVVVENSNVGENLQDHALVPLIFEAVDGTATAETIRQPGVLEWALKEWQEGRGGPLSSGVSGTSFLSYSSILPEESRAGTLQATEDEISNITPPSPYEKLFEVQKQALLDESDADVQFNFARTGFNPYTSDRLSELFKHSDPGNYVGAVVASTHPFSRGNSHIVSPNYQAHPEIDPRYLSHPLDLSIMADGVLFLQKLFETKPLAGFIKDNPHGDGKKIQPSFNVHSKLDRPAAVDLVKKIAITSWHPIGTCAMLPKDEGGVVDGRLKVYGVRNLRVVDASIMPLHIRGNIASAVYAIAERAADIIKEDQRSWS